MLTKQKMLHDHYDIYRDERGDDTSGWRWVGREADGSSWGFVMQNTVLWTIGQESSHVDIVELGVNGHKS